jgi:hypothetical protein
MRGHQAARRCAAVGIVVALATQAQANARRPLVTGVDGIAAGIAACWRPPHAGDQVTVRLSFTRKGAVIDEPRIVYARSSAGAANDGKLGRSMLKAIRDCAPLHFSAELGSAIAGQVLDIRFIGRNRATVVAPP